MGDRLDRLRSRIRSIAGTAAGALGEVGPIAQVRAALRELRERRVRVPERQLARAVLRAGTVAAASVRTRPGRIEITAELESGRAVAFALIPQGAQFAPRGAKEIFFDVDPPGAASDSKVRDVVGAIASQIARAIWNPALPPATGVDAPGLVDRDGDRLRVDLRTCPAVRAGMQQGAAPAMIVDVITIERVDVDEQGVTVKLALPKIAP